MQRRGRGALLIAFILPLGSIEPVVPSVDASMAEPFDPVAAPIWPCPEGWRVVSEGAEIRCEPWPEGASPCTAPLARYPGESECHSVGSPCPLGDFPDALPDDRPVLFVRADASPGGDGSRAAPFDSIGRALSIASSGTVVALAKGRYEEPIELGNGITIMGACTAETVLTHGPSEPSGLGIIRVVGANASIENVRIIGNRRNGIYLSGRDSPTSVHLEGVVVEDSFIAGISAGIGARVTGRDVVVRGTRPTETPSNPGRTWGHGLFISDDASVALSRVILENNHNIAAFVAYRSQLTLTSALIRTTQPGPDGKWGRGVGGEIDAQVTLREVVLEDNHDCAVAVATGSTLTMTDAVLRRTLPSPGRPIGCGLSVTAATASVERALFEHNHEYAIIVRLPDSVLELRDSRVALTEEVAESSGVGLVALEGATVRAERTQFVTNISHGILAREPGTSIELYDIAVRDTQSDSTTGKWGRGIELNTGARAAGSRIFLEGNRDAALVIADSGSTAAFSDVLIRRTLERACALNVCPGFGVGVGAAAIYGGSLDMERFLVTESALAGAQVVEASMRLNDGTISRSEFGVNIQLTDGSDPVRSWSGVRMVDVELNVTRDARAAPEPSTFFR